MKLLVVGDFHGKFALKKFEKLIQKEKIDLVVSVGDYSPFSYRKLWFKHCYGKDVELWEIIGKRKYRNLIYKDLKNGEEVLKKLNKLSVPVVTTLGNMDYPSIDDISDKYKEQEKDQIKYERKNLFIDKMKKYNKIGRCDYTYFRYMGYVFIGGRGHSFPGHVRSGAYKKHKLKLAKLFKRFSKENRQGKVVFVVHNLPYNTKLDKISKKAPKEVRGEHYGSKLFKTIINKFQPILCVGGHFHENRGKDKIKKTLILNAGDTSKGQAAIVDINEEKKTVKIKFVN